MNYKKALTATVVSYAVIFLVASFFVVMSSNELVATIQPWAMVVINAVVVYIVALNIYFQPVEPLHSIKDGVALGVIWAIGYFILDAGIMVYGFWGGDWSQLITNWSIPVSYAEALLIPVIIGYMERKR